MNGGRSSRLVVFAAAAVAVVIGVSVIVVGARHDRPTHRPPRRAASERAALPDARHAAPPTRTLRPRSISATEANQIARRFAAAWRAWDAGSRSPRDAAALRQLSRAGLWRDLVDQRVRPTAGRPPASVALHPVRAIAAGRGTWRAAVVARHPAGGYLATLVIVATPMGPRVAEIQR
jgi:hypothetical protein